MLHPVVKGVALTSSQVVERRGTVTPAGHGVRGVEHRIGVGGTAVAPRGVPHAFLVTSPVARLLCLHTPGCCEAFYWEASEPIASEGPDPSGPVDFDRVRASALANGGIEILGPPPFELP